MLLAQLPVKKYFALLAICSLMLGCSGAAVQQSAKSIQVAGTHSKPARFFAGADLSYVNEMEDCGATYRVNGVITDPYQAFADAGANLVRVRLWHNATWTEYSDFADVKKTIRKAKQNNQTVLLDFHYSDTWADPEKQFIPAAWEHMVDDTPALAQALAQYTTDVLEQLQAENLLPDMVQVGNETNAEVLQLEAHMKHGEIDWQRNAALLNSGLAAVAEFNQNNNTHIERVLHIAQPENALWWFDDATQAGITDFEIIGLSYYAKWSTYKLDSIGEAIRTLRTSFNKDVLVVETSYPWTMQNFDQANNVLDATSLQQGYPATAEGQKKYMMDLAKQIMYAGGIGIAYWEPAWVSTPCKTLWGTGSHWENAVFFDSGNNNEALPALSFYTDIMALFKQN